MTVLSVQLKETAVPRYRRIPLLLALVVATGVDAVPLGARSDGPSPPATAPAARLPAVHEHTYRMNARVRPLLFWMRKNDIGDALITWRAKPGTGTGYDLLVGSDPRRAPRHINKWGFIREEVAVGQAFVVGVMKQSSGESIKEAEQDLAREGDGGFAFRTITATITVAASEATVASYRSPVDLTFRDVGRLLTQVTNVPGTRITTPVPSGTRPGLLFSVADMLHDIAMTSQASGGKPSIPAPLRYIYYRTLYELRVRSIDAAEDPSHPGHRLLDAQFEIRNTRTDETTRFSILFGGTGPSGDVPLKITFRPRWWFEVELVLVS